MNRVRSWSALAGAALFLVGGMASLVVQKASVPWLAVTVAGAGLLAWSLWSSRRGGAPRSGFLARQGMNAVASAVLVLAISVMVGAIAARHSKQIDLTRDNRYSLSPQSRKVVAGLPREVEAVAFYKETTPNRRRMEDLLEQYRHAGRKLSYRFVDPDRNPGEAKARQVTNYGETVLVSGAREERIQGAEERELTNALIKVTREGRKKFYFLTGHGEHGLADTGKDGLSALRQALERENFDTADLALLRSPEIPADAAAVVIDGPKTDLAPPEIETLRDWMDAGGKMLVMIEPVGPPDDRGQPNLEDFLASWGVALGRDVIIDRMSRLFGGDYLIPIVSQYEDHPITRDFSLACFFPTARSVDVASPVPMGVTGQKLALTGADAWGETDQARLAGERKAQFDEGADRMGPLPVASAFTKSIPGEAAADSGAEGPGAREARLVVIGDSDVATNTNMGLQGNGDFILNALGWLAEEEDLVAIRPREGKNEPIVLSASQGRMLFYIPVVGLPLATLIIGTTVVARRRWRR